MYSGCVAYSKDADVTRWSRTRHIVCRVGTKKPNLYTEMTWLPLAPNFGASCDKQEENFKNKNWHHLDSQSQSGKSADRVYWIRERLVRDLHAGTQLW